MRILLIWPPVTIYGSDPTALNVNPNIPLGLAYIASYLEKNGYEVKVLDALAEGIENIKAEGSKIHFGLDEDQISAYINEFDPHIVGISAMFTAYFRNAHETASIVKKVNNDILVVFGGAHASINPENTLKDKNVDLVVIGEGEETFKELAERFKNKMDMTNILGTVVRREDGLHKNNPRPLINDLDSLPMPARHLLPMQIYFGAVNSNYIMRTPVVQMVTSRGCPGQCTFCSIHSVWGHKWRPRSAKNVVDEIESLVGKYNAREIHFLDDNVAVNSKRMEEICCEVIRRGLDIKWTTPNGIAHWGLNDKLIKKMKDSGCYRLTFGIESGNLSTRKFIKKTFNLQQASEIIRYSNKIGLWTVGTFIFGFPNEDRTAILDSIKYAIKSNLDFALFFLLIPFHGTEVYEEFKREGLLNLDPFLDPTKKLNESELSLLGSILAQDGCSTKNMTKYELQELQKYAYNIFLRYKIFNILSLPTLLRKIHSREDLVYLCKLLKIFFHMDLFFKKKDSYKAQRFYQRKDALRGD